MAALDAGDNVRCPPYADSDQMMAAMSHKKGERRFVVILTMPSGGREQKSLNRARPTKAVSVFYDSRRMLDHDDDRLGIAA